MSGNKAMRRALETKDAIRINAEIPLINDTTELITPERAMEMLQQNKKNRPINWRAVDEYAAIMKAGKWLLHAQGIVLDGDGNILTGQKRLLAVTRAGVAVYFRVSRGNPAETARLLDRGTPQTARDLAARETERKHSPTESSIARAMLVLSGVKKPSVDALADMMTDYSNTIHGLLKEVHGTKKTRGVLMIIAAIAYRAASSNWAMRIVQDVERLAELLDRELAPETADKCWGRGVAFSLAMSKADRIVSALA